MEFLLAVHGSMTEHDQFGAYASREEMEQALADTGAFNERLQAGGHWLYAGGLLPASQAHVVDGTGAEPVITDGPYLPGEERISGFWVITAPDLDTALALAAEGSKACRGKVEVRPFAG
ncbi:YciI family protein [Arsenicicoccus dermatophilus]|uniref:YciI family protein n=1 Tax=Arsenicicoccus dermatophilus TaxID=1076331 RepID=UPI0039170245